MTVNNLFDDEESLRSHPPSPLNIHHITTSPGSNNLQQYIIIDTGTDISVVNNTIYLHTPGSIPQYRLGMTNQATIPITSRGCLHFRWNNSNSTNTTLTTLYSPQCSFNQLSGYDLLKAGIHLNTSKGCLQDDKGKFLCPIVLIDRNFCLHQSYLIPTKSYSIKTIKSTRKHSLDFIHCFFFDISTSIHCANLSKPKLLLVLVMIPLIGPLFPLSNVHTV